MANVVRYQNEFFWSNLLGGEANTKRMICTWYKDKAKRFGMKPPTWNRNHPFQKWVPIKETEFIKRYVDRYRVKYRDHFFNVFDETDDGTMEIISSPGLGQGGKSFCTHQMIYGEDYDFPNSITEGTGFIVDASPSTPGIPGHTLEYDWNFEDGVDYTNIREDYTYTDIDQDFEDGTRYQLRTITLTVTDDGNQDQITINNIKVYDYCPTAIITGNINPLEAIGETYSSSTSTFYDNDPIFSREWDIDYDGSFTDDPISSDSIDMLWDDNTQDDGNLPCIVLKLTDEDGSESIAVMDITVLNQPPSCKLSLETGSLVTENSAIINESVFSDETLYAIDVDDPAGLTKDPIQNHRWKVTKENSWSWKDKYFETGTDDFKSFTLNEDGTEAFSNSGTYLIYLQVQDDDGGWSEWSNAVTYTIGDEAPFSTTISAETSGEIKENIPVVLTPGASTPFDEIMYYEWDFDYKNNIFDSDSTSSADDNGGIIERYFFVDPEDGEPRTQSFDVAVRAVDYDKSRSPIANLGGGNEIVKTDTGFFAPEDGNYELIVERVRKNDGSVVDYDGTPIEEGEKIEFMVKMRPESKYDSFEEFQWDFDYIADDGFTVDHVSYDNLGYSHGDVWYEFDSFQGGTEYSDENTPAEYNIAVRGVDDDGSLSDVMVLKDGSEDIITIEVKDITPVASFTCSADDADNPYDYEARSEAPITFNAQGSTVSPTDGSTYNWVFDPAQSYTAECEDESIISVILSGPEEGFTLLVTLTITETINGDESSTENMLISVSPKPQAALKLQYANGDNINEKPFYHIMEDKSFTMDGTESKPENIDDADYSWFIEGFNDDDWFSSPDFNFYNKIEGLSADDQSKFVIKSVNFVEHLYQPYSLKLKVSKNNIDSIIEKTLYVQDIEPDTPISVVDMSDDADYMYNVIDGKIYGSPCTADNYNKVRITAEEKYYPDNPVIYKWNNDYYNPDSTFEDSNTDNSWEYDLWKGSTGKYNVACKKTDADGSVHVSVTTVYFVPNMDDDEFVDEIDDDIDGDGIMNANEIHTKTIKSSRTQHIGPQDATEGQGNLNLVGIGILEGSDVTSAIANIGIKHEDVSELKISIAIETAYNKNYITILDYGEDRGDKPVNSYTESIDLLALDDGSGNKIYSPSDFEFDGIYDRAKLKVEDSTSGNTGFIEYFTLDITHKSEPKNTDTDGDGITDDEELTEGDNGVITNPCDPDSDGDGLLDGDDITIYKYDNDPRYNLWVKTRHNWGFQIENTKYTDAYGDEYRTFYGEAPLKTNPAAWDTDGDLSSDANDIDPLHDAMMKMDIYKFQYKGSNADNDNIYFAGEFDDGSETREFCTEVRNNADNERLPFSKGIYYFNIHDTKRDNYKIDVDFGSYSDNSGKDKKLDCNQNSNNYISEFKFYPEKNGVEGDVEGSGIINEVQSDGYTQFELLGDNSEDIIHVWVKLSLTYADKMNTYLIAQEDSITNAGERDRRYTGDDQYYTLFVKDTTYDGNNEHSILVPKSTFYACNFYTASQDENGLASLDYISSTNNGKFISRDYTSNGAVREIEGVIKLESVSSMSSLFDDLRYDSEGNKIASKERLNPYAEDKRNDARDNKDYIHSIGISGNVMELIPNAKKATESKNRDRPDDKGGFGFKISFNDVEKFVGSGLEYIAEDFE